MNTISDHPIIRQMEAYGYPLHTNFVEAESKPNRGAWGSRSYYDKSGYPQVIADMTFELDDSTELDIEDDSASEGIVARLRKRIGSTWRQVEEGVFDSDEEIYEHYGIDPDEY